MTNDDFSKIVDTNDEWIQQRTGIKQRRVCGQDEAASDLAYEASVLALKDAGIGADEIDLIVVGTVTGDHPFPSTSCLIQEKLGAKNAGAFDVGAACAGFIYSVDTAAAMIESGRYKRVLVVGVDVLTKFMDWNDRATCVLFGDGAGAVVMEGHEGSDHGLIKTVLLANGEGACHITLETGGSRYPQDREWSEDKNPHIYMNGREVYRFAVGAMGDACMKVLELAEMNTSDIDLFVPHQANSRIITAAAERLELPEERVFINVQDYGNTSGGSIPIALAEAVEQGRLKKGMVVMTVGFGAGLVWGANLIRW
jgi:3-oxoacyl-[acyl-carrier-protein] synthase-3